MKLCRPNLILAIILTGMTPAHALPRLAVLDFELNDITSLPNTPAEKQRTSNIKPLLEHALAQSKNYEIVLIPLEEQAKANASFAYLWHFPDQAVQLAQKYGADWLLIGQHSKPSHLFSYLMGKLIEVKSQTLMENYAIEMKGTHPLVLQRSIENLAEKIEASTLSGH